MSSKSAYDCHNLYASAKDSYLFVQGYNPLVKLF